VLGRVLHRADLRDNNAATFSLLLTLWVTGIRQNNACQGKLELVTVAWRRRRSVRFIKKRSHGRDLKRVVGSRRLHHARGGKASEITGTKSKTSSTLLLLSKCPSGHDGIVTHNFDGTRVLNYSNVVRKQEFKVGMKNNRHD
jgi:hypothetical protein